MNSVDFGKVYQAVPGKIGGHGAVVEQEGACHQKQKLRELTCAATAEPK